MNFAYKNEFIIFIGEAWCLKVKRDFSRYNESGIDLIKLLYHHCIKVSMNQVFILLMYQSINESSSYIINVSKYQWIKFLYYQCSKVSMNQLYKFLVKIFYILLIFYNITIFYTIRYDIYTVLYFSKDYKLLSLVMVMVVVIVFVVVIAAKISYNIN